MFGEQGTQHHDAAFGVEQARGDGGEFAEGEVGEAIKRDDLQAGVTGERGVGEQLAFELKCGLLGREENQRRAIGRAEEFGANLGEAAESFAAASGAEEEARLHGESFSRKATAAQKNKEIYFAGLDGICPGGLFHGRGQFKHDVV